MYSLLLSKRSNIFTLLLYFESNLNLIRDPIYGFVGGTIYMCVFFVLFFYYAIIEQQIQRQRTKKQ